jgi:uncharacterized protein (TIGR03000 family)
VEGASHASAPALAPATVVVTLPAEAKLTVDGQPTTSTSTRRVFVSPALTPGNEYTYTLKAEFAQDGKPVQVTKEITVRAGLETKVTIEGPATGVAKR